MARDHRFGFDHRGGHGFCHGRFDHTGCAGSGEKRPGLAQVWGASAFSCPYCHGYEFADLPTGLLDALVVKAGAEPACDLARRLVCAMADGMQGPIVATSALKETSVQGVFAAGDLARAMPSAVMAAADGAMAGVACHRALALAFPRGA